MQRPLRERLGDGHALCLASGGEYRTGIRLSTGIKLLTRRCFIVCRLHLNKSDF